LEKQVDDFRLQAHKVAEWDKMLFTNSEAIIRLHEQVEMIQSSQSDLERHLELIATKQNELHELLNTLESEVDKLSTSAPQTPADQERQMGYELADRMNGQLLTMNKSLKELIDKLNASATTPEDDNPVGQMIQILNIHLNSLQWIDQNATALSERINEVDKSSKLQRQKGEELVYRSKT